MKIKVDEKKIAEELGELILFHIKNANVEIPSFGKKYPELYWKVYIPAKGALRNQEDAR